MSSINISEGDFTTLARAANDAKDKGDTVQAAMLDKIARKVNAALGNASISPMAKRFGGAGMKSLKWTDVPSTLL